MKNAATRSQAPRKKPRRISIADAKAKLSSLIRETERGATVIQNRGRDVAVLISLAEYERVRALASMPAESKAQRFLREVAALKEELGGGVDDFSPSSTNLHAQPVDF